MLLEQKCACLHVLWVCVCFVLLLPSCVPKRIARQPCEETKPQDTCPYLEKTMKKNGWDTARSEVDGLMCDRHFQGAPPRPLELSPPGG